MADREIVIDPIRRAIGKECQTVPLDTVIRWEIPDHQYLEAKLDEERRCLVVRVSGARIFIHGACSNEIEVSYKTLWEEHLEKSDNE